MKIKHPEFWNMIKKKEANLLSYENSYKTRDKIMGEERMGFESVIGHVRRKYNGNAFGSLGSLASEGVVIDAEEEGNRRGGGRNN